MSDDDLDVEYPHWRDAVFNHGALVNLRCAAHYVLWHGAYALLALIGVLVVGVLKTGEQLARPLNHIPRYESRGYLKRARRGLNSVMNHPTTETIAEYGFLGLVGIIAVWFVGIIVYSLVTHFWTTISVFAGAVALIVFVIVLGAAWEWCKANYRSTVVGVLGAAGASARRTGEAATEMPVVNRVYGKCPVKLGQSPKWFEGIFPDE